MLPIKIKLYGDFFDCQLYRGRLYLWTFEGTIKTYNWGQIIESLIKKEEDRIAFTFAFVDCNFLYKDGIQQILRDKDFYNLLLEKFHRISKYKIELDEEGISFALRGEQDVIDNSLPIDTEIFGNTLFTANDNGLIATKVHSHHTIAPISKLKKRLWDCKLLSIKASKYGQLALSAGSEGLFELKTNKYDVDTRLRIVDNRSRIFQITANHSQFANYARISLYNSSSVEKSCMALFGWENAGVRSDGRIKWQRSYNDKVFYESDIFPNSKGKLSWGTAEKIYKSTEGGIEVIHFNNFPKAEKGETHFTHLDTIPVPEIKSEIVSGGVAVYGTVIETENSLIVELSNKKHFKINSPVTRWRIYPRAKLYTNQMHVILEDHMQIISFNHDYFIRQEDKLFGTRYTEAELESSSFDPLQDI